MLCTRPYRGSGGEYGCGQCIPCRINRSRLWTSRLILEGMAHEHTSFVTLTYADEWLPANGSVSVREAQLFLKRLRKSVGSFRYFIVGEYGDLTWRPHYHAMLFGVRDGLGVDQAWGKGHVKCSGLGPESAAYIAGYTVKKMTFADDPRLAGRSPEFARMSLRPGIGYSASTRLADFYSSRVGARVLARDGHVSAVVRTGGKLMPLGRYLRQKVRDHIGADSPPSSLVEFRLSNYGELYPSEEKVLAREESRVQRGRSAAARFKINASKKGVGL